MMCRSGCETYKFPYAPAPMMRYRAHITRGVAIGLMVLCSRVASGIPSPEAEKLIVQGDAAVKAMHSPEALTLFQQAAKLDPGDADVLLRISQQYSNLIGQAKKRNPNVNPGRFREIVIELVGKM